MAKKKNSKENSKENFYKPNLKPKSKSIVDYRQACVVVILSIIGGRYIQLEFLRAKDTLIDFFAVGHILLLFSTIMLVLLWIWASKKELDLCFTWLDPDRYSPPSNFKETVMIIGSGFFLCLLLVTSINPFFYSIAFALYSIVTGFTNYYAINEIHTAIKGSRIRLNKELNHKERGLIANEYLKAVNVLEVYFIERPQTKRFILIAIFSLIGLGFGVSWKLTRLKIIGFITYFLFFLIISSSEIVVNIWRIKRDNQLRPIESEKDELIREYEGSESF